MSPFVSGADQDQVIRVEEKNFQARQAGRQHCSLRSTAAQSPVTVIVAGRFFNIKEEPPPAESIVGRVPAASKSEKELGDV